MAWWPFRTARISASSRAAVHAIVGPPVINSGVREVEIEAQLPVGPPCM
jgi:hypothetical protein